MSASNAKYKCDHEDNRCKVCAVCGSKIVFGSTPRSKFIISGNMEQLIRQFSNELFNIFDSRYPKSICISCKVRIYEWKKGNFSRAIPQMPNYVDIQLLKELRRQDDLECCCFICLVGREKSIGKTLIGRGAKKESIVITTDNGLYAAKQNNGVKSTDQNGIDEMENNNVISKTVKLCSTCFAEVSQNQSHVCNPNSTQNNFVSKIEKLSEKTQDNILHKLLATKAKISSPSASLRHVELTLRTGGRQARVILNPKCKIVQVLMSKKSVPFSLSF